MKLKKIIPMTALLLAAVMGLSTCGLQEYEYLYPPSEASSSTDLVIYHNTSNISSTFLGYQIYYRIYCGTSSVTPPAAAITDASTIESSWADVYPDVVIKRLKAAGYVPMVSSSSLSSPYVTSIKPDPFLAISSSESSSSVHGIISLSSVNSGQWTKTVGSATSTTLYVRRNAKDASSNYRTFYDLTYSDDDCEGTGNYFWIRAYAFAYGLDNSFSPFYSTPIRLTSSTYDADTLYLGSSD